MVKQIPRVEGTGGEEEEEVLDVENRVVGEMELEKSVEGEKEDEVMKEVGDKGVGENARGVKESVEVVDTEMGTEGDAVVNAEDGSGNAEGDQMEVVE